VKQLRLLACKSTPEIAEAEEIDQATVARRLELMQNGKFAELHRLSPASLQLYDVWSFQSADEQYGIAGYPGRIPGQVVENLLWYFTNPGDVVLEPPDRTA
jgi:hypothetical protein